MVRELIRKVLTSALTTEEAFLDPGHLIPDAGEGVGGERAKALDGRQCSELAAELPDGEESHGEVASNGAH